MAEMYVEDTWLVAENINVVNKKGSNKNPKENNTNTKDQIKQNNVVVKEKEVNMDSVAIVKKKETKKDSVVVVKQKEVKKDSVVVVMKKETKKDSVVVVKQKEVKKDSVVVVKKKEAKKDSVVVAKQKENKKDISGPSSSSVDCKSRQYTEPELALGDSLVSFEIIYFSYEKYELDEKSRQILATAFDLLKKNKAYRIEIDAHSDSRGSDKINLWYSKVRAKNVANYFNSRGISATRITYRGNGELKLKNLCCDDSGCSEELHSLNRRAELRIILTKK